MLTSCCIDVLVDVTLLSDWESLSFPKAYSNRKQKSETNPVTD